MSYDQPTDNDMDVKATDVTVTLPILSDAMRSGIGRMPDWLRYRYETRVSSLVNDARLPHEFAEVVAFREAVAVKKMRDTAIKAVELAVEAGRVFSGSTATVESDGGEEDENG